MVTLDERAHENFGNWGRWTARLDPETDTLDESGILARAGSADFAMARAAIRTDSSLPAEDWAETVTAFLGARGRTACIHTRIGPDDDITEQLIARGYQELATLPEMVCEQELPARDAPDGVTVRFAETPADISAYAQIAAEAFSHLMLPHDVTVAAVDHPDQFLAGDSAVALAEIDGVPVAGAQVLMFDENQNGYVAWVACTDAARGRGLGDTVTRAVTNEAFRRGAGIVSLEASPFGEHTYARMGYRDIYRYRMLVSL